MFHSASVTPILTFGRSSFGPWMTTAARGGPAMCIVEGATNRAHVTASTAFERLVGAVGDVALDGEHLVSMTIVMNKLLVIDRSFNRSR